ncbi:MAG: phosphatidylglycerophosphatase A [Planctomycetes bacterium]|nr:phosphatidylglycerophosphatase A [Planctomycetota bacterium]
MDRLTKFLLSFGGLGYLPVVPGTWGTLGAVGVAFLLPGDRWWPAGAGAAILVSSALTIALGRRAERLAAGKDPQFVVLDEVAGYFVTVLAFTRPEPLWLAAGFFVFRVLDIKKPWPAKRLEKLPAGVGVLLDDLLVGVYGLVLLTVARWLAERWL